MFIGHFAVGFAAKRWAPRTNLGYLLLAPLLLDFLWPLFVLLGVERFRITPGANPFLNLSFDHYPWSHSLLLAVLWGLLFLAVARSRGAARPVPVILAAGVVSHWVLDWITHRPDLPLWPGGPLLGLGLWNSPAATVALEAGMLVAAAWLYFNATRPRDRIGAVGPLAYLLLLPALYVQSLVAPPPPSGAEGMIAIVGLVAGPALVLLAGWFDAHRDPGPGLSGTTSALR